jgi:CheY-like chemotaxis protein
MRRRHGASVPSERCRVSVEGWRLAFGSPTGDVRLSTLSRDRKRASMSRVPTTVLIVDDHPSFRAIARAVLADGGYSVVGEAADAGSALAAARTIRPDCVLLDVGLGDDDGFAVAEALAGDRGGPAVILTSGRDPRELEPMIRASSARGFIPKERLSPSALGAFLR